MDPQQSLQGNKVKRVEVYWHAVSYKTVALFVLLLIALVFAGIYFVFPNAYANAYAYIASKFASAVTTADADPMSASQSKIKFVNLDGKVQVKKVNSVQWVDADYHTVLDKGDLIQTGSDGLARIAFADSTSYVVNRETLITVEENNVMHEQTSTAVRINTGQVDLNTPASPNSRATVNAEEFSAIVRPNSHASVKADPNAKEGEITVTSGSAEVQHGQERVEIGTYQRATITQGMPIAKTDVLAPPDPSVPRNLAPILSENPKTASIHFEWKPVPDAVAYTLRISTTTMFTKLLREVKNISGTSADVSGLDAGDYYWDVIAVDAKKQTSEPSAAFKFALFAQGKAQDMALEITGWQLHGRVVEIYGRTEPGAVLIVNAQPVANIAPDGNFRYFTEALEPGEHTIVIIGQNRRGGTATRQVTIVVPK
jgi:FecR protein